jgi:protoporphyrinogen oxidase
MVTTRFGKGIAEKFLIPYNEKLYACDMSELDADAMGRFFPYADLEGIVRNFREADNHSYNAHFTYPRGGAIQYVNALAGEVDDKKICLNESLLTLDLDQKLATTSTGRTIQFEYVISSAPFDRLVEMSGIDYDTSVFSYNKVMVFNLGFDRKGWEGVHWVYFPERKYCFYRVGFYDNIFDTDRMSLYVEIGYPSDAPVEFDKMFEQTLADLKEAGVTDEHQLVSHHRVLLDPAYVHITQESNTATEELRELFKARGVYSVGRYGGWTYCAIEDNIVEARTLANNFNTLQSLSK